MVKVTGVSHREQTQTRKLPIADSSVIRRLDLTKPIEIQFKLALVNFPNKI